MNDDTVGHLIDAADELDPTPRERADLRAAAEMRTCNGTAAAGGHIVHSRRCPFHGEAVVELAVKRERDKRYRGVAVYLVVMDRGGIFGAYLDFDRGREAARNVEGVLVVLPIIEDYRP